jgi:hypothetical protein
MNSDGIKEPGTAFMDSGLAGMTPRGSYGREEKAWWAR